MTTWKYLATIDFESRPTEAIVSVDKDFIHLVQGRFVEQWIRTIDGGTDKGSWLEYPWLVKFQVVAF